MELRYVFLLCLTVRIGHAENHPCVSYELAIDVTARSHQDERLIPRNFRTESVADQPKECHWTIRARYFTSPRPLILEGVPSDETSEAKQEGNGFSLKLYHPEETDCKDGDQQEITGGTFRVLMLSSSRMHMSVSFKHKQPASRVNKNNPIAFRAMTPLPGFCARDMLSFHGNCYALSPMRSNATFALSNIRGAAQLASFSSLAEIEKFIAANSARLKKYPYMRPLDLSQPVRVGIFYRAADAAVVCVNNNRSNCSLVEDSRLRDFKARSAAGPCATLRVDEADRPVVEFGNCSSSMRSLISFSETDPPISSCTANCSLKIQQFVTQLLSHHDELHDNHPGSFGGSPSDSPRPSPWQPGGGSIYRSATASASAKLCQQQHHISTSAASSASSVQPRPGFPHTPATPFADRSSGFRLEPPAPSRPATTTSRFFSSSLEGGLEAELHPLHKPARVRSKQLPAYKS